VATTHYTELKKYAIATGGVENASVEFDVATLSPTYRLSIGTPGRSNAFEISKKLGLSEEIIREARTMLGSEDVQFEEILSKIEKDRKEAEAERDEAIRQNIEMKKIREEVAFQKQRLAEQKEKILAKAKEEARDMIKEAKAFADEIQNELRALEQLEDSRERNRQYENLRKKVRDKSEQYKDSLYKAEHMDVKPVKAGELVLGSRVRIISLDQKGHILTLPDDKGELQVQVGLLKVNVKLSDIAMIEDGGGGKKDVKTRFSSLYSAKAANISTSISLRGMNLDEAVYEIDKYLDDAYMAGLRQATVIHGKGEGILKAGLRDFFKHHRLIDSFSPAPPNEGGDGATIVRLKG
jgi:DNA mismatch repair protein MutS2